jgi:hypothetical protein
MADRKGTFSMIGDVTAAQRLLYARASGRAGTAGGRRRRKKKSRATSRATRRTRKRGRGKLKKGSAAAKAWGRRMKALRKRR